MWDKLFRPRRRAPLRGLLHGERGQGLPEYAMILVLVGVVVIVILAVFGEDVRNQYCQAVWTTVGPDTPAPICENVAMTCRVASNNPTRVQAVITEGGVTIDHVYFFIDGKFKNDEYHAGYCLVGGDGPCTPIKLGSGKHRITAIAVSDKGTTGRCSTQVTVP